MQDKLHKYAGWYALTHWSDRTKALCGETILNKNQRWRWAQVTCHKCLELRKMNQQICANCGKEFTPKSTVQKNCGAANASCYVERMRRISRKTNQTYKLRKKVTNAVEPVADIH